MYVQPFDRSQYLEFIQKSFSKLLDEVVKASGNNNANSEMIIKYNYGAASENYFSKNQKMTIEGLRKVLLQAQEANKK